MARKKQETSNRSERKAVQHGSQQTSQPNDDKKYDVPTGWRDPNAYLQPGDSHFVDFHKQLSNLGLMLRDVPGDGNCLFRALGDQMEGTGANHMHHRLEVVKFMIENDKDFAPFVDDQTTFMEYLETLRRPGTYAGQDVLVAFARMHKVNIVIHQLNYPLWHIEGGEAGCRQLHLSYHNGEHYSSVRKLGDTSNLPANISISALPGTSQFYAPSTNEKSGEKKVSNLGMAHPPRNQFDPLAPLDSANSATEDDAADLESGNEMANLRETFANPDLSSESDLGEMVNQVMEATNILEPGVIMDTLLSHNMNVNLTIDYLCNYLIFKDPPTPPASTPPRRNSPSPNAYRMSGAKPKVPKNEKPKHLSNRERKEQGRRERLQRQQDKQRAKTQNQPNSNNPNANFLVENAFTCLHL